MLLATSEVPRQPQATANSFHGPVGPDEAAVPSNLREQVAEHVEVGAVVHISIFMLGFSIMWSFGEHQEIKAAICCQR